MADFTREKLLDLVKKGELAFERRDLKHINLAGTTLDKINFRRADLQGANFEGAKLKGANLASASLRDACFSRATLSDANLQKAELEEARLDGAFLDRADLSRANLEGANLEGAQLQGAKLGNAQLEQTSLGKANLEGAFLGSAELIECDLSGANLKKADLSSARLTNVKLEESVLIEANLREASLKDTKLEGANLTNAILEGAELEGTRLQRAELSGADLRFCDLRKADLAGAKMTGAKLFGIEIRPEQLATIMADWVDFSADGSGKQRISLAQLVDHVRKGGTALAPPPDAAPRRVFGKGDVMRNASLEFGALSVVEVEGRFEKCSIKLGEGAHLRLGPEGVMESCKILGDGEIVILGTFSENGESAGIVGARQLIVGKSGSVTTTLQQPASLTRFAFERGCHLRMKIIRAQ